MQGVWSLEKEQSNWEVQLSYDAGLLGNSIHVFTVFVSDNGRSIYLYQWIDNKVSYQYTLKRKEPESIILNSFLSIVSFLLGIAAWGSIVYAPFAKNWRKAIGISFYTAFIGASLAAILTVHFNEDVPGMFFIIQPFFFTTFAIVARAIKIAICSARDNKRKGSSTSTADAPPIIENPKSEQQNKNE